MKSKNCFHLEGVSNGFVNLTIVDDEQEYLAQVTPRKLGTIVSQLLTVDDKQIRAVMIPINEFSIAFKISRAEAQQLVAEIDKQMNWKRGPVST